MIMEYDIKVGLIDRDYLVYSDGNRVIRFALFGRNVSVGVHSVGPESDDWVININIDSEGNAEVRRQISFNTHGEAAYAYEAIRNALHG